MKQSPVVLITGASSGIGAAAALLFAQDGYRVALAARRTERLQKLAEQITTQGGQALVLTADVTRLESIEKMVAATIKAYDRIDVLFNNAGIGRIKWLEDMQPEADIINQIRVNLQGVILTARAVLPHMMEQRCGHIINMASLAGQIATPTYSVYAATKFGLRGFSQALRREVGVWGIKVSTIYPGGVDTEFASHLAGERKTGITTPKAMLLTAEDVARETLRIAHRGRCRELVLPRISWLGVWLNGLCPRLFDWIVERNFTRPERGL